MQKILDLLKMGADYIITTSGLYQKEYVKHSKKCRCNRGQGHGPYWFFYPKKSGYQEKKYIGKTIFFVAGKVINKNISGN